MSAGNVELVQRMYAAFAAGDAPALGEAFDPDVVWRDSGHDWHSGTRRGRQAVLDHLFTGDPVVNDSGMEVLDILSSDTRVAVVARTTGSRSGTPLVNDFVQLISIRDGLVTEVSNYNWDQQGMAEFLSRPL
jgi:ketosteroid isomerase-like protein